jgi:hypothetical protein
MGTMVIRSAFFFLLFVYEIIDMFMPQKLDQHMISMNFYNVLTVIIILMTFNRFTVKQSCGQSAGFVLNMQIFLIYM